MFCGLVNNMVAQTRVFEFLEIDFTFTKLIQYKNLIQYSTIPILIIIW